MMVPTRRPLLGFIAGLPLARLRPAVAQPAAEWPSRPVRIVVPYPPGGTTDMVARQFADFLRARLPQPLIIENRPGASTNIGTEAVARAAADGHTLLFGATSLASNPIFGPVLPGIDPLTAFEPCGMLVRIPYLVAANPRFAASNATEMIGQARAAPGRHTIASAQLDFQVELLKHTSRIQIEHVGYRGGAAAMTDTIAGQVDMVFALVPVLLASVRSGALKPIGVTSRQRSSVLPDVQTFVETGQSATVTESWFALFAPAGTPRPIVARLGAETIAFAEDSEVRVRMTELGVETSAASPAELGRILRDLTEEYRMLLHAMPTIQR